MRKFLAVLLLCVLLAGCATGQKTVLTDKRIDGPKVIALDAPRTPWTIEIEARLKKAGFKVLRKSTLRKVTEQVTQQRTEQFNEATADYVLVIEGHALMDAMHRCFGGGYQFDYINAELVDVRANETLVSINGSGYSEGCPPLAGTIYQDIVDGVNSVWAK
ncbi:MAG: hypothetical protein EOP38_01670 [Rubrivivax sp.]|nr:MAG: hypothetical protein EOP38_01670 [Rubrivivax sp.]